MNSNPNPAPLDDRDLCCQHYFDALPAIVSVQDRDLNILQSNDLLKERFGEPSGRPCYEVLKGRKEKCIDCPVEETFRTGQAQRAESVVTTSTGEETPVIVYTSPIRNDKGEVVRVLKLAADISDAKKTQKKLFRAQQRLNQFFNEVPCYVLVQNRDLKLVAANRRFKEDFGDDVGDYCYKVYKHRREPCLVCPVARSFEDGQSHQSEEVVTSMSGDQYNVMVHTAPIRDEKGVITHVVEMSTNITPLRELQSQLESTGLLISSISHSIKGLLQGLDGGMYLVNSGLEKDNQERVEKGWEMVSVRGSDDEVHYEVADNGIGMDREAREKVFSLFFSSKGTEGTGLGLFVANSIAKAHGGSIEVDSEVDRGTRLVVRLPRKRVEEMVFEI